MSRLVRLYLWLCWIPGALVAAVLHAAGKAEGFAAVGVAGLVVFPLWGSGLLALAGLGLVYRERRLWSRVPLSLVAAVLVAAAPLLWLGGRVAFFSPPSPPKEPMEWAFRCESAVGAAPVWADAAPIGVACSHEKLIPIGRTIWRCRDAGGAATHRLEPGVGLSCTHLLNELPPEGFQVLWLCPGGAGGRRFADRPERGGECREMLWLPSISLD